MEEFLIIYIRMLSRLTTLLMIACLACVPLIVLVAWLLRRVLQATTRRIPCDTWAPQTPEGEDIRVVGFFHPYCNAGGGGERVLWVAIRALQRRYNHLRYVVYTGDLASRQDIFQTAQQRFNITFTHPEHIHFIFLKHRQWVEASPYPMFTLLGQSLGSLVLAMEALVHCVPDVFIDSMGYAFTYPLVRYIGCCQHIACYVHYPTISTDMLQRVARRHSAHNNAQIVSRSAVLSYAKLIYYKLFAYAYGLAGNRADIVMVNSSWTLSHVQELWTGSGTGARIVYPPCDVKEFLKIALERGVDERCGGVGGEPLWITSVAQFRPEKDHKLQIESFKHFLDAHADADRDRYRLVLVGSCRNVEDEERVSELKRVAQECGVSDLVEFKLNVKFSELKEILARSSVGLHTMWNEHFGIGVVECMAAGTLILAHDSGGPKLDIVMPSTGFLACDISSYSDALSKIFSLSPDERLRIRENARVSVQRFSEAEFERNFLEAVKELIVQ